MAGHFVYDFENSLPTADYELGWKRYQGRPPLIEVVGQATEAISTIETFATLPARNQKLVLDMAGFAMAKANRIGDNTGDRWRQNFWGLYIVGSRARGDARPDSDLDLLSAGTFYRDQRFSDRYESVVFDGFDLETPDELPTQYNVGDVDRKYLLRATPSAEGVLPVDLSVVDLTFCEATLDSFKETMDIAEDRSQLPRIPLFELTVPQKGCAIRW